MTHRLFVFGLLFSAVGLLSARSAAPGPASASADERLAAATFFALGGVGYAGLTSPGEVALNEILAAPATAGDRLREVFKRGTPAAKAYALVGLHRRDPAAFTALANTIRRAPAETFTMMDGCIAQRISHLAVITRLETPSLTFIATDGTSPNDLSFNSKLDFAAAAEAEARSIAAP